MRRQEVPTGKRLEKILKFDQCPFCEFDLETGEGETNCHYYQCPYLPEELNTICPRCMYNFHTKEGAPECSDPPSCEFARFEAPARLKTLNLWIDRHRTDV